MATHAGSVTLGPEASVWYAAVLCGDRDPITIRARSNLQDGRIVHTDPEFPTTIGAGVSVGHRAVLHGDTVEDDVLVGMGAIGMNGAVVGAGSIVGTGALLPEGMQIAPRSLVLGAPAKVRRLVTDDELDGIRRNADSYVRLAEAHRAASATYRLGSSGARRRARSVSW